MPAGFWLFQNLIAHTCHLFLNAFVRGLCNLIPSLDNLQILAFMIYGGAWDVQVPLDIGKSIVLRQERP